jgi:hypothetical protein
MTKTVTPQMWVDRTRNALAFFLVGSFVGALVTFTFKTIAPENKDILTYMAGQLSGMATMALGFYFTKGAGQDQLDAQKTENTGKLAEAMTATAKAAVAAPARAASEAAEDVAAAASDKADEFKGD